VKVGGGKVGSVKELGMKVGSSTSSKILLNFREEYRCHNSSSFRHVACVNRFNFRYVVNI
jgi:hypothetical protein